MIEAPVWETRAARDLPELTNDAAADVCVVGLGGSGLACVHALLAAGHSVVGVDAVTVAGAAAGRNGGFLLGGLAMFHHDAADRLGRTVATEIYEETLKQIARMAAETPAAVRCTGSLRIALSPAEAEDCSRQYSAMRLDGLPAERYEGSEGAGLFFPRDAAFHPALRCWMLATQAVDRGARLFVRSPVLAIEQGCVVTPSGRVTAQSIVVAVDGRIETILPELAPRVRTARLQMLATAPVPGLQLPYPVYARWGSDYWQQLPDGRVVLGGFRDAGGAAEWTTSGRISEPVQAALTAFLRDRLRVTEAVTHRWAANVGYTHNGMPILEEVRPDVWAIGAYSGTGNVLGALCGRAVAEKISCGASRIADLLRN
jgi:glycine/D-amino acid oxidase-like deaminating enzyme